MKKIHFVMIIMLMIFSKLLFAQATDLFFSEYIEGSSNNKALEIFNGTGTEVELSDYIIRHSTNGGGWKDTHYTFPAGATISDGDVWVIANENSNFIILNQADETLSSGDLDWFAAFNGNDARGLFKIVNKEEILIDVIGIPDEDPGSGWEVAGVSDATKNHTLIRKSSIASGNADWSLSAGTNEFDSEWEVHDEDYFSDLGNHTFDFGEDTTPPTISNAIALSTTSFQITYSEEVSVGTAEDIGNYAIDNGLQILSATLQANEKTVEFETSTQTENLLYTVTVNNIQDLAGNPIEDNSTISFAGFEEQTFDQIADIQANQELYEGQIVTVRGVITIGVNQIQTGMTNAYMQDESGKGINIFDFDELPDIVRGSLIELTGTVTQYEETTEITDFTYTVIATDQEVPIIPMTINEMQDYETWEGTFISISGSLTEEPYYAGGGFNLNIIDEEGYETTVRVWDTTEIDVSNLTTGIPITAHGIVDSYAGYAQVVPGYQEDIIMEIEVELIIENILNSPTNPFNYEDIEVSATIIPSDGGLITEARLYYALESTYDFIILPMSLVDEFNNYSATIPALNTFTENDDDFIFHIWAIDSNDQHNISNSVQINVRLGNPVISNISYEPEEVFADQEIIVNAIVIDPDEGSIENVILFYQTENTPDFIELVMNNFESNNYEAIIPPIMADDNYLFYIRATDNENNETESEQILIPVSLGPPIIEDISFEPDEPYNDETITVRAKIYDQYERSIINADLYYRLESETDDEYQQIPMTEDPLEESYYFAEISPLDSLYSYKNDNYVFYIFAKDNNDLEVITEPKIIEVFLRITPIANIQDSIDFYIGKDVAINAIITVGAGKYNDNMLKACVQDTSGKGIFLFDYSLENNYLNDLTRGRILNITGTVDDYQGTTRITNFDYRYDEENNEITIDTLIQNILFENFTEYEGSYVVIEGIITEPIFHGFNSYTTTLADSSGNNINLLFWESASLNLQQISVNDSMSFNGVIGILNNDIFIMPAYQEDLIGPYPIFENIAWSPSQPSIDEEIRISAVVYDHQGPIEETKLFFKLETSGFSFSERDMIPGVNEFFAYLPAANVLDNYIFYLEAEDEEHHLTTSEQYQVRLYAVGGNVPIADIQDNTQFYLDQEVTIEGVITIGAGVLRDDQFSVFIQDESGRGLNIFDYDITEQYYEDFIRGNRLSITGTIDEYDGTTEIKDFSYTVLEPDPVLTLDSLIVSLTISEVSDYMTYEGTYVELTGTIVDDPYFAGGGYNITLIDEENLEITIRIWETTGIDVNYLQKDASLIVRGIVDSYNSEAQIVPGYFEDVLDVDKPLLLNLNTYSSSQDFYPIDYHFYNEEIIVYTDFLDDHQLNSVILFYRLESDNSEDYDEIEMEDTQGFNKFATKLSPLNSIPKDEDNYIIYTQAIDSDNNTVISGEKVIEISKRKPILYDLMLENQPDPGEDLQISIKIEDSDGEIIPDLAQLIYSLDFQDDKLYYLNLEQDLSISELFTGTIPGRSAGTTINIGAYAKDDSSLITILYNIETYTYPVRSNKAILKVAAKPFNPYAGETFMIGFYSQPYNKAILRIYNAEGKLVFTPQNIIITNPDGINHYEWNGKNKYGKLLPLGLYICYLETIETGTGKKKSAKAPIVIGAPLK